MPTMPSNIPPHVQAWAKAHGRKIVRYDGRWAEFDAPIRGDGLEVPPSADSDAWLAGMVRAMQDFAHERLMGSYLVYATLTGDPKAMDRIGTAPTLEAAIIAAVLGDQADAT